MTTEQWKWMAGVSAWLALVAGPLSLSAQLKPESIYQRALPSVMTLEVENEAGERFVGSGFLALGDDIAVTAWHVVSDARSVWAIFADGERVKVIGCIDENGGRDLALLKLEKSLPHRQATLCGELQTVAARAYVIGAPKGYDFSISDGLISQIRRVDGFRQYQVSCPISPGNSGGPVLNERGEVIGIASWTKADAQNVSFAIPTVELKRLNATLDPTPWERLVSTNRPTQPAKLSESRSSVGSPAKSDVPVGTLDDLKKRLEKSAGRTVTVVVEEDGRENRFTFSVPRNALK
jgi:S1-C subfamily serine protease